MRQYLFKTSLLVIFFVVISCSNDDSELKTEPLQVDSGLTTPTFKELTLDEAKVFFQSNMGLRDTSNRGMKSKSNIGTFIIPSWTESTMHKLRNDAGNITMVPVTTDLYGGYPSWLTFSKAGNQTYGSIITTVPSESSTNTLFSGYIIYSNFEGQFINGYKLDKGYIKGLMVRNNAAGLRQKNHKSIGECEDLWGDMQGPEYNWCILLEGVTVTAPPGGGSSGGGNQVPYPAPPGGAGSPGPPSGGGGPPAMDIPYANMEFDAPDRTIEDLGAYLECFNTTKSATFTLYADQPIPGSPLPGNISGDVGHAFVSLHQDGITTVFGFYPEETIKSFTVANSAIGNDGGHTYDVSISTTVTGTELGTIIYMASNYPQNYNLNYFNCTDYAIGLSNLTGMDLSDCWAPYPGGGGSNPGTLGQNIRNKPADNKFIKNEQGGTAPNGNGCN